MSCLFGMVVLTNSVKLYFLKGSSVIKDHRGFPTYQGENQSWISKAAIYNAILHNSDYLWLDYIYSFKIYKRKHLGVSIFMSLCNNSENL